MKEINIKDMVVSLLNNSNTTVNKLFRLVHGKEVPINKHNFEKFRKDLVKSVKLRNEWALELFPIIKYFESKKMTEEDYADDEILFTFPTGEKIAVASPIEVLDDVPEKKDYDQKIYWDLIPVSERESEIMKAVENYFHLIKDIPSLEKAILSWARYVEKNISINLVEKDFFAQDVPQEVFALNQSDNLNALLPTELVQLDDPELEYIFYKNFIEKKLLSYQLWGIEREIIEDIEITEKDFRGQGPLFVCIDTSGSMRGIQEVISKALALTIVYVLDKYGMNVVLIPFSMKSKPLDLMDSKNKIQAALNWLSRSFYGGTDFTQLVATLNQYISDKKYSKSNIVVISDFVFKNLNPSVPLTMKKLMERMHSMYSVKVSQSNNKNSIEQHFSANWQYVFNWKGNPSKISDVDVVSEIAEANIKSKQFLEEIRTFGFIKKIKDYEFVAKTNDEIKKEFEDGLKEDDDELSTDVDKV